MTAAPVPMRGDRFEPYGLGWRAVMGDGTIRITVRRLRHDHGALKGYIDVEYRTRGSPKGTPPERLAGELVNLSLGRDRTSFANRLTERKPGLDWRNMIDAFCIEVEHRDDLGEEAVWIGNLPAPIDGGWLIEGLLERAQNNEIHGDGSVGKSWIALAAAVSVTTGLEVIPGFKPLLRGNVLYCDWETDQDTHNARVQQISRALGLASPYPQIRYLRMDGPFADATEKVLREIHAHDIILVILDSVEAAMGGSTGAGAPLNEGPNKIHRGLRRLGRITTLVVDHISAEQVANKGVNRKAYGSIFKRNWIRRSWDLKQAREPSDGKRHLGLFYAKANNGDDTLPPIGLRWTVNAEEAYWEREAIEEPELEASLPLGDRIAAYLSREGPCQQSAVVGAMHGAPRTSVISALTRQDRFYKNERGLWDLAAPPPAPLVEETMPPDDFDFNAPLPLDDADDAGASRGADHDA